MIGLTPPEDRIKPAEVILAIELLPPVDGQKRASARILELVSLVIVVCLLVPCAGV